MRKIALLILMYFSSIYSQVTITDAKLDANNIRSWICNTGVFDRDFRTNSSPGLEWPKGTGKFAIFNAGLTIGTFINNQIRFASATHRGEYAPGHCINAMGLTNASFKIYKVTRGDNQNTNPDWANWGLMVPYGAPFKDVNNNGTYQPAIDIPGVRDAAQTIFVCLTDAFPGNHTISEFGGGTPPIFAEVHFTAWCYDNPGYGDMQFLKWVVINKHLSAWDSAIISIVANPDLGNPNDDYIGCDSANNLGFCYNSDNNDEGGYGLNPPIVGMMFLNCSGANSKLSSFVPLASGYSNEPSCEPGPGNVAYNYLKGLKNDGTPWVNIITNRVTKFCYSGDVESGNGWTEFSGRIENCGGSLSGPHVIPSPPSDKWFAMSYKPPNRINPGDSQVVMISQFIARGSSYLNTFTRFKFERDKAKTLCQNGFVIGINPISTEIPEHFNLYQNYPNPFNPVTKIRFQIPLLRGVDATSTRGGRGVSTLLTIYDALGREITTLINKKLQPGVYSVDWDGTTYPSGVYFYKLRTENYSETKKMVMIK